MFERKEVKAVAVQAALVSLYTICVLSTGAVPLQDFTKLFGFYLKTSLSVWTLLGIGSLLVAIYVNRPVSGTGPNPFVVMFRVIRDRWDRDRYCSLLWPLLLFATLMASFNAFKQMILPAVGFRFDPLLAHLDKLLFFGTAPWRLTHAVLGSPASTEFIDLAYHGWFAPMSLGVLLCSWLPRSTWQLRNQYLLSYIGVWIVLGSVVAFVLPAAGPCFYETFVGPSKGAAQLMAELSAAQAATGAKLTTLSNRAVLLRHFNGASLAIGAGISAMPSVHNALAVLFAIAARQASRIIGFVFAAYAILIWIGSVHLGWHYAVDGLAAAAGTWMLWTAAGRLLRFLAREGAIAAATPGSSPAGGNEAPAPVA